MVDFKQQLSDLAEDLEEIKRSLNVGKQKEKLKKLEARSTDPNLWDNQVSAKKLMQEIGEIKDQVEQVVQVEEVVQEVQAARELGMEKELKEKLKQAQGLIEKLKLTSFLSDPYDKKNAIVSIHAGQGGTEAMDWVSMLYRMYLKFCEKRKWLTETLEVSAGEGAGLKSVTFTATGIYAYGYLKGEAGTHRLVRKSPFNADQKRETSFALVEVLPEFEDVDLPDIEIKDDELDWQFFRASTQGGQNVQKVSTAVRLTHKPTGIVVTSQTERYQEQNRKYALNLLRSKLWALEKKKREEKIEGIKGDYKPASWGQQIRSYVLHPYKMVKDLRTQIESSDPSAVLDGDLDKFIEAELKLVDGG